jgi:hypothetical protein
MSATRIFADPPRKPLTPEQLKENARNKARASLAEAAYRNGEAELRARLEAKYGVTFEPDEGGWYVDAKRIYGEFDFDKFTEADWAYHRSTQMFVTAMLNRNMVKWPDFTNPKDSSPVEDSAAISDAKVRFRQT